MNHVSSSLKSTRFAELSVIGSDALIEMDVLLRIAGVAELREEVDHVLDAFARAGEGDFVILVGDPDVEPGVLRELDAALERVEVHRGESEALGGGVEEIVAVRILDQILPRVVDGRLVRAFASEIVRQIEWLDDLIEELGVALGRS